MMVYGGHRSTKTRSRKRFFVFKNKRKNFLMNAAKQINYCETCNNIKRIHYICRTCFNKQKSIKINNTWLNFLTEETK